MNANALKSPDELREKVAASSCPTRGFYALAVLSTTIAAYGLLANSTAVVIGAMLVAPLMGPIFGIALALVRGDRRLVFDATVAEATGVLVVLGTAFLIGLVPLRPDFGSEIMARTSPTVYDIIVALASGAAGAYAQLNKRIEASIAGVAIATALVPPLAASGLCFAAGLAAQGFGAFLLFAANFLAIELAAAAVFAFHAWSGGGFQFHIDGNTVFRRFGWSALLLILMGVFMTRTLAESVSQRQFESAVRQTLAEAMRQSLGAQLDTVRIERTSEGPRVVAVVLTPTPFDSTRVAQLERTLGDRVGNVSLVVRSVSSKDADRDGAVFLSQDELSKSKSSTELARFFENASAALRQGLADVPGATLEDLRRADGVLGDVLHATVSAPEPLGPQVVAALQDRVAQATGSQVSLVVRSVIARVADHQTFLFETDGPRLTPAEAFLRQVATSNLRQSLGFLPGATVTEVTFDFGQQPIRCRATIEAPRLLTPEEVGRLEDALNDPSERKIALEARVVVAGTITRAPAAP